MQFESKTTQFISTYYFETKARDEDKYKFIVRIFAAGIYFPFATFLVFGYLAFFYSEWIARLATKFINGYRYGKTKQQTAMFAMPSAKQYDINDNSSDKTKISCDSETNYNTLPPEDQHKWYENKRIRIVVSLIIASILLIFTLLAFHIIASVKLIQYGNEVLYDDNDDQGYNLSNDDQCVPIVYVVCSFVSTLSLVTAFVQFMLVLCFKFCSPQRSDRREIVLGLILQYSLGGFLVYLGFYFLPYMLLSFIHDPIQSALVYMMLSSVILTICIFTYVCVSFCEVVSSFMKLNKLDSIRTTFHLLFTFASGLSITYFLTILILILTLGNLHDFQGVELLTLSVFLGLLSIFLLKPSLVRIKSLIKKDPTKDNSENLDEHKS